MPAKVKLLELGKMPYRDAWAFQEELFAHIITQKLERRKNPDLPQPENFLLMVEHPPVFTLGKSGKAEHVLTDEKTLTLMGAEVVPVNRGGDITFHGPGQIVIYPILDLDQFFTDIHKYLRFLEEAVIQVLAHYDIQGERSQGETGVWIEAQGDYPRKICAMGVRAARWVTMHGLAFNINTDLSWFDHIVPCGIQGKAVASLQNELKREVPIQEVKNLLISELQKIFEWEWE